MDVDERLYRVRGEGERERNAKIVSSVVEFARNFVAIEAVEVTVGTLSCTAASKSALRIEFELLFLLLSDEYIIGLERRRRKRKREKNLRRDIPVVKDNT